VTGVGSVSASRVQPARAAAPTTVLVVEDDQPVRALVRTALEDIARVREAGDADEALTILEDCSAREIDVLLVDYKMPRRSGLELLRLVNARWPWLSMIMMTGFGSEELAIQALRAGARDYLRKPLDVKELRSVVAACARVERPPGGAPSAPETPAPGARSGVRRALAFVREHFAEPITLSQVASEAGLSKFHFCRLFQRRIGVSFREYLCGLRLERARALLADRELTVTEVAYAIGFNDLSHFDKVFNRTVGMSPTEYRRSIWTLPEQPQPSFSQPRPRPASRSPLRSLS
jgi:YesN/AraC family two-component response regulator